MKNATLIMLAAGLTIFISCGKSHTCTCKDASGKVMSTQTKSNLSKSDADAFKTQCENQKIQTTVNGSVTSTVPCEYQ